MKGKPNEARKSGLWVICDHCGRDIHYGNASVCFCRNIEQADRTAEHPDGDVTVIESTVLVTLCGHCGNRFGDRRAMEVLRAAVNQPVHALN